MTLVICVIAAIAGSVINVCYWQTRNNNTDDAKKRIRIAVPKSRKGKVLTAVMVLAMVFISVVLAVYYERNTVVFDLKRIALLLILFPAAMSDYLEHIIPNSILKVGLVYWVILSVWEFISNFTDFKRNMIAEVVFTVILFGTLMLLKLIAKDGIGMGDIKLIMLMALFQGGEGLASSIMSSIILLFFIAVILSAAKKKGRKDVIPFGPAILAGTYLSILLMGA